MKIPFVIDNREHNLADVLNDLLNQFENRSIDIATAYFTVRGFQLIKGGLGNIGNLRLRLIEDLIAFLRRPGVDVRLAARVGA